MSVTPGVSEATPNTPVAPAETGGGIGATAPPAETGTAGGGADLARTLSEVMTAHPDSSIDTMAALAGITPEESPPVVDPARATTEPAPIATTEVATQTPEEVAPPLFRFVEQAQLALEEAKKAGASLSEIKELEVRLQHAQVKESYLTLGANIIQTDKDINEAKANGASEEELAALMAKKTEYVTEQARRYDEAFQQIKSQEKSYKKVGKSLSDAVDDMLLTEATSTRDEFKLNLKDAERSGNAEEINDAKLRLQAAEMHMGIIKKKKGKGILALLATLILAAGVTAISDGGKVTKGELIPQRGR